LVPVVTDALVIRSLDMALNQTFFVLDIVRTVLDGLLRVESISLLVSSSAAP
jgi:hypothetical protein